MKTVEEIVDDIEAVLEGPATLASAGYGVCCLNDLGEVYIRAPGGEIFKMALEPVSAEDAESWGLEFTD